MASLHGDSWDIVVPRLTCEQVRNLCNGETADEIDDQFNAVWQALQQLTENEPQFVLTSMTPSPNIRGMSDYKNWILAVLWLICAVPSVIRGEFPLESTESVLVLRNGFVLRGFVTPLGDHYLVTQANSDRVRMPVARVEMVCADLNEAYARKRDLISIGDVHAHLKLASWCLRHQLEAGAADQVLAVIALDPGNPQIPSLHNRLLAASQPKPVADSVVVAATTTPLSDADDLQISVASIQGFTTSVQPLLMNRCAAGACHGPGTQSKLELVRPPFGHLVTSRLTQRNLRAVLAFVHRETPRSSPLLTVPQRPHGGLLEPVLDHTVAAQTANLQGWLEQLRIGRRVRSPSRPFIDPSTLLEHTPPSMLEDAADTAQPEPAAPAETSPGKDPFDPALFNEQPR